MARHKVLIIGGGVAGLCTGWYLSRAGHHVAIVDRDPDRRRSCSTQNAGMVVPSHFIPLAAPGVVAQGLRWMTSSKSPFYLRPKIDLALWRWCWQFYRHCTDRHVQSSRWLLRDLSLESRRLFEELASELEFEFIQRGLLMLCRTSTGLQEEMETAEAAESLGITAEVCDVHRLRELDPDATTTAIGGIWFPQDGHLDPAAFLSAMRQGIADSGGVFIDDEITGFATEHNRITAVISREQQRLSAEVFVLCGGAWSTDLAKKLGTRLPIQGGKGYSLTLSTPRQLPRICSLLKEARVAVTPIGRRLRVAGTMEICGGDLSINSNRVRGIIDSFCQFFPEFKQSDFEGIQPWTGLRPCSPDGLPYLGTIRGFRNLIVNTGHAMLGLSLGPVCGRIVADLVNGAHAHPDIRPLDPARFG